MPAPDPCFPSEMRLSPEATAHISAAARLAMWSSPDYFRLYPYFNAAVHGFERKPAPSGNEIRRGRVAPAVHRLAPYYFSASRPRKPRWRADVLMIGEARRPFLIPMMQRLLTGVINAGLSVIYLARLDTPEHEAITELSEKLRCTRQLLLLDPWLMGNIPDRVICRMEAYYRAQQTYHDIEALLPNHLYIWPQAFQNMFEDARSILTWDLLRRQISYDLLVVRNHFWPALSAAAAIDSIGNGKLVVTLQHGAISDLHTQFPIAAHRMVCYGESSRQVFGTYDRRFAEAAGRTPICKDFLLGGSLFDTIKQYPNASRHKTVLVLDQCAIKSEEYYGVQREFDRLFETVRQILLGSSAAKRVIIRLHPTNRTGRMWMRLKDEFPDRVELSLPEYLLDFDLQRSSVVLGIFSTGLPSTAACGIPTLLLWEPDWFYTPDLAGFAPQAYIAPEEAVAYIDRLLTNDPAYAEARDFALQAGSAYYHRRRECDFGPELVGQMTAPLPDGSAPKTRSG
jgi:hypothetical protein